jgi:hypothetical protein
VLRWIISYAAFEILVVGVAVAVSLWRSHLRRNPSRVDIPRGFTRTEERFVDPTTGVTQVVWFHEKTGERHYQPVLTQRKR